jgi:hypothetical protein
VSEPNQDACAPRTNRKIRKYFIVRMGEVDVGMGMEFARLL